jgi:acetyltransferase-like isoleucine patch superfamily enzyme
MAAQWTAHADVIVDTGEPVGTALNANEHRAGLITLTSPTVITGIEQFISVFQSANVTFTLRSDSNGLPGAELYSAVASLSAGGGWLGISGLNWGVSAGTYWVTFEDREGQDRIARYIGTVPGDFPPNALAAEAAQFIPPNWALAGGRTGWRVFGTSGGSEPGTGYTDPSGRLWRDVNETKGFSWNDIAARCPTDGASPCNGTLGSADLTGWVWATREQVRGAARDITGLTTELDDFYHSEGQDGAPVSDTVWAPKLFNAFARTDQTSDCVYVFGLSSTTDTVTPPYPGHPGWGMWGYFRDCVVGAVRSDKIDINAADGPGPKDYSDPRVGGFFWRRSQVGPRDTDADGIEDSVDNCPAAANSDQVDTNNDGHGDACVSPFTFVPRNATVDRTAIIGANVQIGKGAWIGPGVTVADGAIIDQNATIQGSANIGTGARIGRNVRIASGARIGNFAVVGQDATICTRTTIGERAQIGQGSTIGAQVIIPVSAAIGAFRQIAGEADDAFAACAIVGSQNLVRVFGSYRNMQGVSYVDCSSCPPVRKGDAKLNRNFEEWSTEPLTIVAKTSNLSATAGGHAVAGLQNLSTFLPNKFEVTLGSDSAVALNRGGQIGNPIDVLDGAAAGSATYVASFDVADVARGYRLEIEFTCTAFFDGLKTKLFVELGNSGTNERIVISPTTDCSNAAGEKVIRTGTLQPGNSYFRVYAATGVSAAIRETAVILLTSQTKAKANAVLTILTVPQ